MALLIVAPFVCAFSALGSYIPTFPYSVMDFPRALEIYFGYLSKKIQGKTAARFIVSAIANAQSHHANKIGFKKVHL